MEKAATPECQLFIAAHYAQNNIDTSSEDWVLEKKYKNFHGFTCRDFTNKNLGLQAMVVAEETGDVYKLKVWENASYKTFLDEMSKKSLFYYVPVITNDGLVFYFEKTMKFDAKNQLDTNRSRQIPYLTKKLGSLFKKKQFLLIEKNVTVAFPEHTPEEVIKILEENGFEFNSKIFGLLSVKLYKPVILNIQLTKYTFPEDVGLSIEEIIELIFSIVSQQTALTNEEYARIKNLLKNIPLEEMNSITNIMTSFRPKIDNQLELIIKNEENNKKNQILWKRLLFNEKK